MKKPKYSVSDFKRMYNVMSRKLTLTICGFVVGAYLVGAVATTPIEIPNDLPLQKTEVSASNLTTKEAANARIIELEQSKASWFETVDEVCAWPDDWDGEGAVAVKAGVDQSVKTVIDNTKEHIDILDNIYPTAFGSICIEWGAKNLWVNAEVTKDTINFYYGDGGPKPIYQLAKTQLGEEPLAQLRTRLDMLRHELLLMKA